MALTTRQVAVIAVGGVCVLISTLAVLCRALGRRITRTQWQLNDYLMLLAYFFALGFVGTSIAMTTDNYVGAHVADIPSTDLAEVMVHNRQNIIIACLLFTPCTVLVNLSITHFYTRIFPQAWLVRTCKLLMVFYVFYELAAITTCFLLCRPLAGLWDPAITHAKCLDIRMFWTVGSAGCLGFDLTTLALPMPVLWGLRMPDWRKKVRLTVLFGLGVVICGITATRIYYYSIIDFDDITWGTAPVLVCCLLELALAILAGSLPIMTPCLTAVGKGFQSAFSCLRGCGVARSRRISLCGIALPAEEERAGFKRLGSDVYPLEDVVVGGNGGGTGLLEDGHGRGMDRVDSHETLETIESTRGMLRFDSEDRIMSHEI